MRTRNGRRAAWLGGVAIAWLAIAAGPGHAQEGRAVPITKQFEDLTPETVQELFRMYSPPDGRGRVGPMAVPDIFGHGAVLTVGKINQKVANFGFNGNPFSNLSSDPSGQWPGQSGVEYLFFQGLAVGGVNPSISPGDPVSRRRVSQNLEWRPPTLLPEDRIYPGYDGVVNGQRFVNDDDDKFVDQDGTLQPLVDEDFLDGRDNDGDGKFDEDFGALGQQMYSLVMRDDTEEAIRFTQAEPHVPLGLECRVKAWAYSLSQLENFNVFEYEIFNRSGHEIDSLVVGFQLDMDCGPVLISNYYIDDIDAPQFPSGSFHYLLDDGDARRQATHDEQNTGIPNGQPLCTQLNMRVNGFSIADDNGDEGKTLGVPSFLLFTHTIDPLGLNGPSRVGFRSFRSYAGGDPYAQGGVPRIDQQRFEVMAGTENIDPETGFINHPGGDQRGDYGAWCSTGPWLHVPPGASVSVTVGFAVQRGTYSELTQYPVRYGAFKADSAARPQDYFSRQQQLFGQYPALKNAFDAQVTYEGIWEASRAGFPAIKDQQSLQDNSAGHGQETKVRLPRGSSPRNDLQDCRDVEADRFRPVTQDLYTWFDFDCDYCTGIYDFTTGRGMFHKIWNASAPPPSPGLKAGVGYNYTDNHDRVIAPAGDNKITLAWDNLSEITPDPGEIQRVKNVFDFRGYKIYKVSNWTRPVGSPGPSEDEWALVAEFTLFDYRDASGKRIPNNAIGKRCPAPCDDPGDTVLIFPRVWIPQKQDSAEIRLFSGDLWDRQSGTILTPDRSLPCVRNEDGDCETKTGCVLGFRPNCRPDTATRYPVGRYRYEDTEVKNGFIYFYSVTAFDSSADGITEGRKSAVEAEGVVPQTSPRQGRQVWVVPNPYKGFPRIAERPSTWDLTPNATDPTGTHIDFMGLPQGQWTIRIYTVAGDLVQEIHSTDAVNESVRGPINTPTGTLPGFNRQQDTPNDGQAAWNLISRNGQDIVSGIYLFTVESSEGIQRGRFVVVR